MVERCEGCGFVWDDVDATDLPRRLAAIGPLWRDVLVPLDRPPGWAERVRTRPRPEVWSPLEYGCHVRDVLLVQRERIYLALVTDEPEPDPMHREERVELAGYPQEDPGEVVTQIRVASELLARSVAVLHPDQLARRMWYAYPARSLRDLRWVGAQAVHEAIHHAEDAGAPRRG